VSLVLERSWYTPESALQLLAALTQPSAQGQPPLLVQWAPTLTRLRTHAFAGLLETAASCAWPVLQELWLTLECEGHTGHGDLGSSAHVQRWLQASPALKMLGGRANSPHGDDVCRDLAWQLFLSAADSRSLTELNIKLSRLHDTLPFLRAVSSEAMPQLRRLTLDCNLIDVAEEVDEQEAIALLQRMPLTALSLGVSTIAISNVWRLLHHLPQLTELHSCEMNAALAASVAAAPQLQKLHLSGNIHENKLLPLVRQWGHRLGRPPLRTHGRVDEIQWLQHQQKQKRSLPKYPRGASRIATVTHASAPLTLRELVLQIPDYAFHIPLLFPYLALFPHLRVLECTLSSTECRALGLLPRLEELRLWPGREEGSTQYSQTIAWRDGGLRTLGSLPLSRLRILRLCASGYNAEKEAADLTFDGLRALLRLRSLTVLGLPLIDGQLLAEFRLVKEQLGRRSLLVERYVPLEWRLSVEQHWLDISDLHPKSF